MGGAAGRTVVGTSVGIRTTGRPCSGAPGAGARWPDEREDRTEPGTVIVDHRTRVVLVEDHPAVREQLTAVLRTAGLDVIAAVGDLLGGLEAVRRMRPDVVVVDNRLPDGRGVELCEMLAREVPESALIVHSGAVTGPEIRHALAIGVRAVVPKSLRGRELLDAVLHAVDPPSS